MHKNMNKKTLSIIALLLLLGLIASLIWGFGRSKALTTTQTEQAATEVELEQMNLLRDNLARQIDSLALEYEAVASDNEALEGSLSSTRAELEKAKSALAKAQKANSSEKAMAFEMRQQIEELIRLRSDLERSIDVISAQNDSLRQRTQVLEENLASTEFEKEALANLNRNMQAEINRLTLDNFKATAFQVELTRGRNDQLTSKAGRGKRLTVSFDLAGVPKEYQGVRPLYLVVTDDKSVAVTSEKTIPVKITINQQPLDLQPLLVKEMDIEESQRINFTYELDQKLKAGFYRAQVFTDVGLLGASSFRLN